MGYGNNSDNSQNSNSSSDMRRRACSIEHAECATATTDVKGGTVQAVPAAAA